MELEQIIYDKIVELCAEGDKLLEDDHHEEAIDKYTAALELVPSPKKEWEASLWIYSALGDAHFLKGDFGKAKNDFYDALNCPDGQSNSFVLLRLGQSLYESGELEKAKEQLLRAYILDGDDIFEDEDEKYINLIADII